MNFRLLYNFRKIRKTSAPRPNFKRELQATLSKRYDDLYGNTSIYQRIIWSRSSRIILASTLGFSLVGTSAYAYTSPQVTEGSFLYGVKIGIEKIEEKTKTTNSEKVKFLIKQAERRNEEREVLVKRYNTEVNKPVSSKENFNYEFSSSTYENENFSTTTTTNTDTTTIEDENEASSTPRTESESNGEKENIMTQIKKTFQRSKGELSRTRTHNKQADNNINEKAQIVSEDVVKTDQKIDNVEQKLNEVKSVLKDDEEGRELKKMIEAHFEKNQKNDNKENDRASSEGENNSGRSDGGRGEVKSND